MPKVAKRPRYCKPSPDFPLTPHPRGYWCKKVDGKVRYFGRIDDDPLGVQAREKWRDLLAGRTPENRDGLTVEDLCDHFITAKDRALSLGTIAKRTHDEYRATCKRLIRVFGPDRVAETLRPSDFNKLLDDITKRWGLVRSGNEIQKVRTVFKFGYENEHLDKPLRFGTEFVKPAPDVMRKHRAARGEKMIEAEELRRLINEAPLPLKAMVMLGINAAFGNHDCAMLPLAAVKLDRAWIIFPRPKSGIPRRCPLWPETVEALREALAARPVPKDDQAATLFFLTARGRQWLCRGIANPISVLARRLMKSVGIDRDGTGFYALRHSFRTVADEVKDSVAIGRIMGHADGSMADIYRERIDDQRLQAVVDHVHSWLFKAKKGKG